MRSVVLISLLATSFISFRSDPACGQQPPLPSGFPSGGWSSIRMASDTSSTVARCAAIRRSVLTSPPRN